MEKTYRRTLELGITCRYTGYQVLRKIELVLQMICQKKKVVIQK